MVARRRVATGEDGPCRVVITMAIEAVPVFFRDDCRPPRRFGWSISRSLGEALVAAAAVISFDVDRPSSPRLRRRGQ